MNTEEAIDTIDKYEIELPFGDAKKIIALLKRGEKKLELSKREIEVILDLMGAGETFLITHQWADKPIKEEREIINLKELKEKLRKFKETLREVKTNENA